MPTELEEVAILFQDERLYLLILPLPTARRVPPPWQYPNSSDWYAQMSSTPEHNAYGLAATENLVPFSRAQPEIFKTDQLKPVNDLKVLVRDYSVSRRMLLRGYEQPLNRTQPIAKNALTILINISSDRDVLKTVVEDEAFIETIIGRMTVCQLAQSFASLTMPHILSPISLTNTTSRILKSLPQTTFLCS